jgi:hypothetical protein
VFQPLIEFPAEERARWERYIVSGRHREHAKAVYRQRVVVGSLGILAQAEEEEADVRLQDSEYYVCPWRVRIRILASLLSVRESTAPEVADAIVPEAEARRAAKELSRLRRRDPSSVPFMLESTWQVPIRWFILFHDDERRVVEAPDGQSRIVYTTTASRAKRRVGWALSIVRRTDLEPLVGLLSDMSEWLASFDDRSLVELDYASVARLMTWNDMDEDHSAREVEEAIDALGGGEIARSGEIYQGLAGRWAEIRAHESLN